MDLLNRIAIDGGLQTLIILLCLLSFATLLAWHSERTRLKRDLETYRTCCEDQAKQIRQLNHTVEWYATTYNHRKPRPEQELDSMYFDRRRTCTGSTLPESAPSSELHSAAQATKPGESTD